MTLEDVRELRVRAFEAGDQAAVRRLILEGLGEHFGFIDETRNPDLDDIAANYVAPGYVFLVVLDGSEIVGSGALIAEGDAQTTGRIVRVSVHRAHRRRGIGRMVVEHLLHIAHQRGYTHILVETNSDWEDAIGLYKRLGFSEYPRNDREGVHMALELL